MGDGSRDGRATAEVMAPELVAPSLLHELRQPLMGADAAATLLERALAELPDREEWRILRAQLARLAEILTEYEHLLRPGELHPEPFAVGPVVSRAVDLLSHRVRPLAQRFLFDRMDGDREGFGAPSALVHAATNILANALDAVEGTGRGRVEIRVLAASAGGVEVRVSDEGIGIPAENRALVFEPRFTTKHARGGSGLGLHVARRLMSRYGGEVFLVPERDPSRAPWAVTEFCIAVPAPPAGGDA